MPYDSFSTYGGAAASHEDTATTKAPAAVHHKDAGQRIRFMVMSGFLGAGKTTTMIALGEHMDKAYGKVGIIANDLGANLVDTNLTQTSGCTVEEIASGCICYQMDNTIDKIRRLRDRDGASFVMSDIPGLGVGALDHVYHRLADEESDWVTLAPFTVIVDPERLRMLLPEKADIHLPEELVYLMQLQLEEADLVVLNKIDLLSDEEIERDVSFLKQACPEIPVMAISAKERTGIPELAEYLTTHVSALKNFSVRDDERFQEAEKTLTWYNRRMFFKQLDDEKLDCNAVIDDLIEEIRMGLIERKRNVPHLKTFATAGQGDFNKCSLLGVDYDIEHTQLFLRKHKKMSMIINARATCESRPLARIVDDAVDVVCDKYNLDCQVFFTECFGMGDEGR
ncbi:MAG: GTP-binding protein [Coriobacteriales bacterium]|jgi:G3E family GTPase